MSDKSLQRDRVISFIPSKHPHGWIQWKGTDVCVDIHCKCGALVHFDGDFMYHIQCPHCKQIYEANGHIELITVTKEELIASGDFDNVKMAEE